MLQQIRLRDVRQRHQKAGLSSDYTVSSADVENYESSLVPLNNLSKFALTLLIVVLSVGAVVLVVIALLNVRERKYEIGVLTAIGVNKGKVAAQFSLELLIVTMIGLAVGAGGGRGRVRAGVQPAACQPSRTAAVAAEQPARTVRQGYGEARRFQ